MGTWKSFKLNELGKVSRGKSKHRPRNDSSLFGGKYPFIQTGEIKEANFYISNYTQTYNEKGLAQSKIWKKETLCITIAANIAETAILNIDACFPDSIIGFIADKNKSDVKFIKYHFDLLKLHLQSISQGTTQDNLSVEKLLTFNFTVPTDVKEQQEIASILFAYDELIEVNNERIKVLEQTARELYKEWFVRMRFPGYQEVKFSKGVPEGWEVKKIGEICKVARGSSPRPIVDQRYFENGNIPWVKIADATVSGKFLFQTKEYINEYGASFSRKLKEGSLIIATSGTLGFCIFLAIEACIHDGWLYITDYKESITPEFLFFIINDRTEYFNNLSYGSAIQNINTDILRNTPFLKPNKELLLKFQKIIVPINEEQKNLQQQNTELRQIRDRLLPRLISGKLQIKV